MKQFSFLTSFLFVFTTTITFASHIERSSKNKYFGVGGWYHGKDCPNVELKWGKKGVTLKAKRKEIHIGEGMAKLSGDCKYFWHTAYIYEPNNIEIRIYDTKSGLIKKRVNGYFPSWSQKGSTLFFQRGKVIPELWKTNVNKKGSTFILRESNYFHCETQGEGVLWLPVKTLLDGNIQWKHSVKSFKPYYPKGVYDDYYEPEKFYGKNAILKTINPKIKKVIKIEFIKSVCG